jgi:uncharacterized membrane protein
MSNLIVFAFDNETGAEEMRAALVGMQKQQLITLEDAAVVIRRQDGKVKVKQAVSLVGIGALGGAFWGMLIGLLFMAPWLGLIVGAASGALGGKLRDTGVDDKFIKDVGNTIEKGHSALFLLVVDATPDKVLEGLEGFQPTIIQTSLSAEDEKYLREYFGQEEHFGEEELAHLADLHDQGILTDEEYEAKKKQIEG